VGSFLLLIALGTLGFRLRPDLYTGATIFGGANTPAIETMPNAFLFWRSLAHLPALGKWVLALLMVAGRLEIYTILFAPTFWRR